MSRFIYADHAATAALRPAARRAMEPYLTERFGNPSSLYAFGQQAKSDLEAARAAVAACLNARPEEICFTSGGTEADNWALKGAVELAALKGKKNGHIIISAVEHHAVLHTAQHLEKQGHPVTCLPVDEYGRVDPAAVEAAIRPKGTGPKPKRTFVAKDIRLFINTIDHAVDAMKTAGIQAQSERRETEDYIECTVRIPKSHRVQV